ncbi:hypothetical protein ACUXVT_04695 [Acinetobacter soli]|uniref:hypothetical protein n=1 Tax=Acinetobacter soli TaxID=487316 RepID=UPI0040560DBA
MAVANQTPYKEYIGNGTTKIFPLEFDCDDADHLIVKVNDIEVPALNNWSLNTNTGSVVFAIAPISQSKIILQRDTPLLRSTDYQTYNNSLRPQPVNNDFDKIWLKLQELGVTNWLTDTDIKNLSVYVNSLNEETRDDFFNKLGNLEQNTNAMLQEAIKNGAVSALAITTVSTVDELEALSVWDGRTVYVKNLGNFIYNANIWEPTNTNINYWSKKSAGFLKNERVMLSDGRILKNTIDNNKNNPYQNMTGWDVIDQDIKNITTEDNDLRSVAKLRFGEKGKGVLTLDSSGVIKVSAEDEQGNLTAYNLALPFVVNTGNIIETENGSFAEKRIVFPSDNYEDVFQSPSLAISYTKKGKPRTSIITPNQTIPRYPVYPNEAADGLGSWDLALESEAQSKPINLEKYDTDIYIPIAKWNKNYVVWDSQIYVEMYGSNTSDRFLNKTTLVCNYQAIRGDLYSSSNMNEAYLSKHFKVYSNMPRSRVANTVNRFGVGYDGDFVTLYAFIPANQTGSKIDLRYTGDVNPFIISHDNIITIDYAPSNFVFLKTGSDWNTVNSAPANNSVLIVGDNIVRVCNSNNNYPSRTEITRDAFVWCGYGTCKTSAPELPKISKVSTGTYKIENFNKGEGLNIIEAYSTNGTRLTYSVLNNDASVNNIKWLNVFKPKYTLNASTGELTISAGDAIDIPDGSWIDVIGYLEF